DLKKFILTCIICALSLKASPWGFFAHKQINRLAVFTLPPGLIGFYKKNIEYITHQAVNPDKRRYIMENEAPRHYIDLDIYGAYKDSLKYLSWKRATEKFTEDSLMAHGIVPWHISFLSW